MASLRGARLGAAAAAAGTRWRFLPWAVSALPAVASCLALGHVLQRQVWKPVVLSFGP